MLLRLESMLLRIEPLLPGGGGGKAGAILKLVVMGCVVSDTGGSDCVGFVEYMDVGRARDCVVFDLGAAKFGCDCGDRAGADQNESKKSSSVVVAVAVAPCCESILAEYADDPFCGGSVAKDGIVACGRGAA